MDDKKSILIGCDSTSVLTQVLINLSSISDFSYTALSASRVVELNSISKSINPDLIILCFKKNHQIIRDITFNSTIKETPILCITTTFECESLCWSKNCIVFNYPFQHLNNASFFCSRILSIFLLSNIVPKNNTVRSFAETAIQKKDHKNTRELSHYVMELDQKVEVLLKVKERISYLYSNVDDPTRAELMSIVNSIKNVANDTKLWEDFKIYFEQSNPNFLVALAKKHPSLSPKDLKYCCYIKMNMSNNDITNLLGINQESVRTHKYRLKKKLTLEKEQDIITYLRTVS